MAINVIDSIELPSTHEWQVYSFRSMCMTSSQFSIIAKSVVKDRDDSTEPLSEEDEYLPEDEHQASPSEDSGVQQYVFFNHERYIIFNVTIPRRFPARGGQDKPAAKSKPQGSSGNTKDSKKPASTTKCVPPLYSELPIDVVHRKTTRPPPSLNSQKYSDKSKKK